MPSERRFQTGVWHAKHQGTLAHLDTACWKAALSAAVLRTRQFPVASHTEHCQGVLNVDLLNFCTLDALKSLLCLGSVLPSTAVATAK